MNQELETHRNSLMAEGQRFTHGDIVRLKRDFGSYQKGELLTVIESSLQQQDETKRRKEDWANWDSFVNSYSCNGERGGIAWLDLDDIEDAVGRVTGSDVLKYMKEHPEEFQGNWVTGWPMSRES